MCGSIRSVLAACVLLMSRTPVATAGPPLKAPPRAAVLTPATAVARETQLVASGCFYDRGFRRVVRRHMNEVKFCYEQALLRRSDLTGRAVLQLTVAANGSVTAAAVVSDELHEPALAACLGAAAARWQFSPAADTGIAVVTYPFLLQPSPVTSLMADDERRADIRACHEQALWRQPGVAGALTLRINLDDAARVRTATITEASISDEKLLACITSAAQRWRFTDAARNTTFERLIWLQHSD